MVNIGLSAQILMRLKTMLANARIPFPCFASLASPIRTIIIFVASAPRRIIPSPQPPCRTFGRTKAEFASSDIASGNSDEPIADFTLKKNLGLSLGPICVFATWLSCLCASLIWLCDNALRKAERPAFIMAFTRTINAFMLRLDLGRTTNNIFATSRASNRDCLSHLSCSKFIGTRTATSCLPSKF